MVHKQEGCFLYVCTKFEADCSIRSKVIKGSQHFEIWSRDLGPAHFGVVSWSGRSRGRYVYGCAKLEVDKVIKGSQNFEILSRDLGHANFGVVLWSRRSRGTSSVCAKFEGDISIRSKVIRGSQNLEIWSRYPGHAHIGVVLWSGRRPVRHLWLSKIWSRYIYSFQSYKGVPKFRNFVTWPRPRQLWGRFMIRTQ